MATPVEDDADATVTHLADIGQTGGGRSTPAVRSPHSPEDV
jgi:hypothetical protein